MQKKPQDKDYPRPRISSSLLLMTSSGKRLIFAPLEIHVQHLGKEL